MNDALLRARNAVGTSFFLCAMCFGSWLARIPQVRADLGLSNGQLGLLLLSIAAGSLITLPSSPVAIERWGTITVNRLAVAAAAIGLLLAALGLQSGAVLIVGLGLFGYGLGVGAWEVAMNVEGADVERRLGRSVMPRFHACWSLGAVAGAGVGALAIAWGIPVGWHIGAVCLLAVLIVTWIVGRFLPVLPAEPQPDSTRAAHSTWSAWLEPRTVMIGVLVLSLTVAEGTANDWLAIALVDGYGAPRWLGVAGYALFVASMTIGRLVGTSLVDRFGQTGVLWVTIAMALAGVGLIVFGTMAGLVVIGIVLWGLGISLGFPMGMSAAAVDPTRAAARVGVVSTIAFLAFFLGPPLVGFVGDRAGSLKSLLVVAALLLPAVLLVPVTRPPAPR